MFWKVFRRVKGIFLTNLYVQGIVGFLWGAFIAFIIVMNNIRLQHKGLIVIGIFYMAGAVCSQFAYYRKSCVLENVKVAKLTGLISYIIFASYLHFAITKDMVRLILSPNMENLSRLPLTIQGILLMIFGPVIIFSLYAYIALLVILFLFFKYGRVDINSLERIYTDNSVLFNDVQKMIKVKVKEKRAQSINITNKYKNGPKGKYKIYLAFDSDEQYIEKLTDIFSQEEAAKIESILSKKVYRIYLNEVRTEFAVEGPLAYNQIVYSTCMSKMNSEDEIIKKLNNYWYIHVVQKC